MARRILGILVAIVPWMFCAAAVGSPPGESEKTDIPIARNLKQMASEWEERGYPEIAERIRKQAEQLVQQLSQKGAKIDAAAGKVQLRDAAAEQKTAERRRGEGELDRNRAEQALRLHQAAAAQLVEKELPDGGLERTTADEANSRTEQGSREELERIEQHRRELREQIEARAAQVREHAEQMRRQAEERAQQMLREVQQRRREETGREDAERRIQHLRAAAENLHAAGMHAEADGLMQRADELERELARAHQPPQGGGLSADVVDHIIDTHRQVLELREQVEALRREIAELRERLRGVSLDRPIPRRESFFPVGPRPGAREPRLQGRVREEGPSDQSDSRFRAPENDESAPSREGERPDSVGTPAQENDGARLELKGSKVDIELRAGDE